MRSRVGEVEIQFSHLFRLHKVIKSKGSEWLLEVFCFIKEAFEMEEWDEEAETNQETEEWNEDEETEEEI